MFCNVNLVYLEVYGRGRGLLAVPLDRAFAHRLLVHEPLRLVHLVELLLCPIDTIPVEQAYLAALADKNLQWQSCSRTFTTRRQSRMRCGDVDSQ